MSFKMRKNESGFSLVELMIVVGIIGVLAALALPKMQVFMAKAKQSEMKTLLSHIYTLEQSYFAEKDTYTDVIGDLGYVKPTTGAKTYYANDPTFTGVSATAFVATLKNTTALCTGVAAGADSGTIDQNRTITASAPKCN
jgi:prepilin-type N-terminal cleavage/methylation domain-containing protein